MRIDLVSLIVRDYDEAIAFFVGDLGFDLEEDSA
jgi:catechol 2,3-dioxygenase-like lactoylglutathione lyase family enzyme